MSSLIIRISAGFFILLAIVVDVICLTDSWTDKRNDVIFHLIALPWLVLTS